MIEKTGNMLDHRNEADHLLVTTNSIIKDNGCLVMGAGAALAVKLKAKGIDKAFGSYVKSHGGSGGLIGCVPRVFYMFGMFQTKYHYGDNSPLELIIFSTQMLKEYAERNPKEIFYLNFPGINHGHLKVEDVYPIIRILPDNVYIWKL